MKYEVTVTGIGDLALEMMEHMEDSFYLMNVLRQNWRKFPSFIQQVPYKGNWR